MIGILVIGSLRSPPPIQGQNKPLYASLSLIPPVIKKGALFSKRRLF